MPSVSSKQRKFFGFALSHPDERKRMGLAGMAEQSIRDYAATSEKNLPEYKSEYKKKEEINACK